MKPIAFVTPWFGEKIPGGAEMELRGLVTHLHKAGVAVEVLTTCVKEFGCDWSKNHHAPGETTECGVLVRRFKVRKRNTALFDRVNAKLMNNISISSHEEEIYVREMINSPTLYSYMAEQKDNYELFIFIPYMFGTTYNGSMVCPEKSILIPCFHDEAYVHMNIFRKQYSKIAGMILHSEPELKLAKRVFDLSNVDAQVLGEGVYTDLNHYRDDFYEKFNINTPFILYAGRKDKGKNVNTLLIYFAEYKKRKRSDLKLIMIGGGTVTIPPTIADDVMDLGFIDSQDKYNAYAAAELLCQPSHNESFSLVIMESWLCERPVLVSGHCDVTKHFAQVSMICSLYERQ